jgi:flavin-dependent dehydrogenase
MDNGKAYDCAIIGGGIAGLCLSVLLARKNFSVILFEKHRYPFHKVCGEYVSNESRPFFTELGLEIDKWNLPQINTIGISSLRGFTLESGLKMGGFGLSRFKLDEELFLLAENSGVTVFQECKVNKIDDRFVDTAKGRFEAKLVCAAFGKSSPNFMPEKNESRQLNYIGVKYHVRYDMPENRIELHNFEKGYCGISKIEADRYCLCYLSDSENLRRAGNSIPAMEEKFLFKNPQLRKIFTGSEFLFSKPVTISNISFDMRRTSYNEVICLGDAAGCISPLTGNGMSMAARTAQLLSRHIENYFRTHHDLQRLLKDYQLDWELNFKSRIKRGKNLQSLFGKDLGSHLALKALSKMGKLKTTLIESTHGDYF